MNIISSCLELILTDKHSGEEWECSYDAPYIENLTRKTGNFKQFAIFATMLKSGLLKVSDCITLDLLTSEDLETIRIRRCNRSSSRLFGNNSNRRYLIVTYTVEFDKINYPLPLEYCGPPDPAILQASIRRLEAELTTAHEELCSRNNSAAIQKSSFLQKRIDDLTTENTKLREEVKHLSRSLSKNPSSQVQSFQNAIKQIERNLVSERNSHHKLLEKMQREKLSLINQLERLKHSEKSLKAKLQVALSQRPSSTNRRNSYLPPSKSCEPNLTTIYQRRKSPRSKNHPQQDKIRNQRSRSVSPRLIYSLADKQYFSERPSTSQSKSRSRSSSISSAKQSERQILNGTIYSSELTAAESSRGSRHQTPSSEISLVISYDSEVQRNKLGKQNSRSRSVSPNVTSQLKKRVNKMFKKGRCKV